MAQKITGFRAIFSSAPVYNLAQRMVGAEKARRLLVKDYFPNHGNFRMLDIGCGTAEILRHLPENIEYYGFDASDAYINKAKQAFGTRGTFRAELVREASLNDIEPFDIVMAFGLLHHLNDTEARRLFALAAQALKPGGSLITIDPTYTPEQRSFARWIISKDRGQCVRTPSNYQALASDHFSHIDLQVREDLLNIPYSHAILICKS
ncbi:MAG: class I SAM-dependent methyltransferase [Mariprofundus sp.]|nr:class I SAM-dependent methyltransferase [Mariprofundus sp.]